MAVRVACGLKRRAAVRVPTKAMRPSRTTMASALGCLSSTVMIGPPEYSVSAALAAGAVSTARMDAARIIFIEGSPGWRQGYSLAL